MKTLRCPIIATLLLCLAFGCLGCGTNLGEEARLADARKGCEQTLGQVWPGDIPDGTWQATVTLFKTQRDEGLSPTESLAISLDACREAWDSEAAEAACFECYTLVIDAVWP